MVNRIFWIALIGAVLAEASRAVKRAILSRWDRLIGNLESAVVRSPLTALWVAFIAGAFIGYIGG